MDPVIHATREETAVGRKAKADAGVARDKELHLFSPDLAGMPGDESDRFQTPITALCTAQALAM